MALMLMGDYCEDCTEHINSLCGKKSTIQELVAFKGVARVRHTVQSNCESCEQWTVLRLRRIHVYME